MSHLKWSIFRDGYISRILEILVFSEIYNRPKYQKNPIQEIESARNAYNIVIREIYSA